ncbi:zinc finger protein 711-like [Coccinella septempunctata]|uniref:zinc finger protein 711-like n=1 Tax=Coccinella septempunctata TaxID=41139 RepID=UPI001D07E951|nr:zinc finger protein 711-like [Coccinella septempunctata]
MFGETVLVINGQEYVEIETEKEDTIEQSVCEVEEDDDNTSGDKNTGGLEKSDYDEQYSNEECEIKIEEEDIYKRITKREADENNINFDGQSTKILMRQYSDSANVDEQLKLKERKCDFTTGENSSLKIHIESGHLNSRENQCHLCDYAAKRRGYLKVHIENVHMNLKKHQCAMCDYKTCVKNSLKMHISSVHLLICSSNNSSAIRVSISQNGNAPLETTWKQCT